MYLMPLPFLLGTLAGLLSLAVLDGGLYILWAWYVGELLSMAWLAGGLAMLLRSAYGRLAVLRWDEANTPARISVPTLVITGDADRITLPEAGVGMGEIMPNAEVVRINPAGHNGLLEEGQQYSDAIARLVQAVALGRPQPVR